jgi:hypothetical protein
LAGARPQAPLFRSRGAFGHRKSESERK